MSTSSIGRDEIRKPLLDAYLLERRILLGCSSLIAVAIIVWIVAISTNRWSVINGEDGIYVPQTGRYFLWSHSGIWDTCRYSTTPIPLASTSLAVNFTTLAYLNSSLVAASKAKLAPQLKTENDIKPDVKVDIKHFDDDTKIKLFSHWVNNDTTEFRRHKAIYKTFNGARYNMTPSGERPILVDTVNSTKLHELMGRNLSPFEVNGTIFYLVLPTLVRDALFKGWDQIPVIRSMLMAFARDMEVPATILNQNRVVLQLTPPKPPKDERFAHGYEYVPFKRCKLIEMFPTEQMMRMDPSIDEELLVLYESRIDLVRTQASFAVISVMVMSMGFVFSLYTFANPRYMFKRLAGGIHFVSAAANVVVIQVFIASIDHQKKHIKFSYPEGSRLSYGFGLYFAWFVFCSNLFAGIMFMWYSKKKKGNKAPNDEIAMADEAINIGR